MKKIAVYSGTRNLYGLMATASKSLLIHSDVDLIYWLVEDDKLPFDVPDIIKPINVSNQTYFNSNGANMNKSHFTYMAYMRGALPKIFPDIKKILALDVDTIVKQDISDLWELPIDKYYFAACKEPKKSVSFGHLYANTGVTLYNLSLMRKDGIDDKVIEMVNTKELVCPEQDALSFFCKGKIYEMSSDYNATMYTKYTANPKIVHYAGIKDWSGFPEVKEYETIPFSEAIECHKNGNCEKFVNSYASTKYMIHACNERMWYVDDYLITSMMEQGIDRKDIILWQDKESKGNLESFMQSMKWIGEHENYLGGIWHLQDDVVISKDFKRITDKNNYGIVCGFCNDKFDGGSVNIIGLTTHQTSWFSFQCIRIPNIFAYECAKWYYETVIPQDLYPEWRKEGKNDDKMWKLFLQDNHPNVMSNNLYGNLVDHIDFLLGGSLINLHRKHEQRRAYMFDDKDAVENLKRKLIKGKKYDDSL